MSVRRTSKRDIAEKMHERYLKAKTRAEKGELLGEMVELTGYHTRRPTPRSRRPWPPSPWAGRLVWPESDGGIEGGIGGHGLDLR